MSNEAAPPQLAFYTIGAIADFSHGRMRSAKVGLIDVAVVLLEDGWHAFSNYCTHVGAMLTDGWLNEGQVICPFHYACFDINTGELLDGPGYSSLPVFNMRVLGDEVQVELPVPPDGRVPQVKLGPLPDAPWSSRT